ncbi:DUF4089 domain-containing protein [Verticiella sediminum]|uniref:DUF4089 domain-containing protein n=1 Tax=Verticiella sediminum TaxID=1247510 RepID=A0A556AJS7_9BURK|nr:DUF4089 domain-containing protein [Verticiella sediminum]TSH93136.1 DUF4089 domain-containing protein [Verticiella sediminum]
MQDDPILNYVQTAAALLDIPLDAGRAQRVAEHFARTAAMAATLEAVPMAVEDEPAEVYRPAPFPDAGAA